METHGVPDNQMGVNHDETDGEEVKQSDAQRVEVRDNQSRTDDSKESMVAEPKNRYQSPPITIRPSYRPTGL